jgi:hypothetical protein
MTARIRRSSYGEPTGSSRWAGILRSQDGWTSPCDRPDSGRVPPASDGAAELRDVERRRLRALVERDLEVAEALHATVYQLITPGGATESREGYLAGIASGKLNYHVFEATSRMAVRVNADAGILRYQARIEIDVEGARDEGLFWHTDYYERRQGQWQAVWSQATRIKP